MKINKWTVGLAAAGVVSLASTAQAEENSVLTALSSTVIGGNVEASYVDGFSSSNNMHNDGGFEANGASLSIGSPLAEGDYGAGYNVELLLGARAGAFAGDGSDYHLKNANIGLNVPVGTGIDLTVGLFDTIVGYEVEASGHNPNVMRSFGYIQGPRTHTGAMASTLLTDGLSVSVGLTNGFDAATGQEVNDGAQLGYILGAELNVPESMGFLSGSTLYVGYVNGNDEGNQHTTDDPATADVDESGYNGDDNTLLYIGATINTPIERVAVGVAYDDRVWENSGGRTESDSVGVYATYSLSEDASISARYDNGTVKFLSFEDSFDNLALTLDYSIWENVLTRFELGWESGVGAFGTQAVSQFRALYDGSPAGNSSYFALNAFYSF
ncbi:MAG: outer membrane beta-barrel protein [Verrucomicrobiota bacterium]|jgi:hypothetical protein|nr:outer membrane beta-barrel protein [Verrucomicrobiota bacterium]